MVILVILASVVAVFAIYYNLPMSRKRRAEAQMERDRLSYEEWQKTHEEMQNKQKEKFDKIRNNPAARNVFDKIVDYVNSEKTRLSGVKLNSSKYKMLSILVLTNSAKWRTFELDSWSEDERVRCYGRNANAIDGDVYFESVGLAKLEEHQLDDFCKVLAEQIAAETPAKNVEIYNLNSYSKIVYMDVSSWCKRTETVSLY